MFLKVEILFRLMDSYQEIIRLFQLGKERLETKDYVAAKSYFLDAADLTLKTLEQTTEGEKQRYEEVAELMVSYAKKASELHKKGSSKNLIFHTEGATEHTESQTQPETALPSIFEGFMLGEKQTLSIPMGDIAGKLSYWNPGELMNGIMMTTGGSGSGKTEWLKSLAIELLNKGFPVLIIDLHGDIELEIPTITLDYTGKFGINPLELISKFPADGGPIPQINSVLKLFSDAVADGFSPVQAAYIRSLLHFAYIHKGITQNDPQSWERNPPDFRFLRELMRDPMQFLDTYQDNQYLSDLVNANKATVAAVKNRLLPIFEHPAFSAEQLIPIDGIFSHALRINLKYIHTVDMQFIVADTVLKHIFTQVKSMGHINSEAAIDRFRLFIIIDEIKILSGSRADINDNYHILNRLATEARKFGVGMILASQVMQHFSRDIRANSASKLILRPMDTDEAKRNAKELEISSDILLDINRPGLGYYIATNLEHPVRVQLYPAEDRPIKDKA